MDLTVSEGPDINTPAAPQRRSIFRLTLPTNPNISLDDPEDNMEEKKAKLEEYLNLLTSERNSWKKLYAEIKEKNSALKKKLKSTTPQEISLNVLDEEDIQYINNKPNYEDYTRELSDLTTMIDVVRERAKDVLRQKYSHLNHMKTKISIMAGLCCD